MQSFSNIELYAINNAQALSVKDGVRKLVSVEKA